MVEFTRENHTKSLLYSVSDIKISALKTLDLTTYARTDTEQRQAIKAHEWCQTHGVFGMTAEENNYHFKLSLIASAPYVVYGMGNRDLLNRQIMAIV